MISLALIASAPIVILLAYIYYRDKYEKEPIKLLFEGLVAGGVIVLPIIFFEQFMHSINPLSDGSISSAAYTAFLVAGLIEESFKYFAVYVLIWKNPNFNEKFDGIVYAVFVSLGFALVENFSYVFGNDSGLKVGLLRAFTAVPAHAMFGVLMGYQLGQAKFIPSKRAKYMLMAFLLPFFIHGVYDFILMSQIPALLAVFFPFLAYLVWRSLKQMKMQVETSVFNPKVHEILNP